MARINPFVNEKREPIDDSYAWKEFGYRVGWRDEQGNALPDENLDFSLSAPKGCFPQTRRWLHGGFYGSSVKQFVALIDMLSKLDDKSM